jgi:regulator of cell morphogenesis and NO signaling
MTTTDTWHGLLDHTVGQLVAERPARARVLERFGIDYCCHGHRTLLDASRSAGLDPEEVAHELAAVVDEAGAEIDRLEPVALVEHILRTHHDYLHEELPLLVALAEKVRDVHGTRHPELARVAELAREIRDDLDPHLAKEERVLFPAIRHWVGGQRSFPFGTLDNPIRMMMLEHDRAGELLDELRSVTSGYRPPADGCASYVMLYSRLEHLERDTHRHVHLENNVLFPAVTAETASRSESSPTAIRSTDAVPGR